MRHVVNVQKREKTMGSDRGITLGWVTTETRRAHIEPLRETERIEAQRVKGVRTHRVTMRHVSGLTTKHRLQFGTRAFSIDGIRNLEERGEVTECVCVEVTE